MSILRRMVFREFIGYFLIGVISLTALFLIVDFFDRVQRYVGEWGAPASLLLWFMAYKIPMIVYQMTPLALPLSTLVALGFMNRNRELTAMRAGGISARSVIMPVFVFALVCAGMLFALGEYVSPITNEKQRLVYEEMRRYQAKNKAAIQGGAAELMDVFGGWYRGATGIYLIRRYEIDKDRIFGLTIFKMENGFNISSRIDAEEAAWNGSGWTGKNVEFRDFANGGLKTTTRIETPLPIDETPNNFETLKVDPKAMGFFELLAYIKRLESGGSDMREFRVDLWSKIGYPLSGFLLLILAVPFGLKKGRGENLSSALLISIIICITFYQFNAWMISIGYGGVVRPITAAFTADVLYGALGVYAYARSD